MLGPREIGAPPIADTGTADVSAIGLPDGRIRLYFGLLDGSGGLGKMISKESLAFSSEADTGIRGTEPSLLRRTDGSLLVYHGEQTPAAGSTIWLARG